MLDHAETEDRPGRANAHVDFVHAIGDVRTTAALDSILWDPVHRSVPKEFAFDEALPCRFGSFYRYPTMRKPRLQFLRRIISTSGLVCINRTRLTR